MPHVVGVEQPEHIARPGTEQLGAQRHRAHADAAAPVVADEVDRAVLGNDLLDHADQPRDVLLLGGPEPGGHGATEPGELRSDHIGAAQLGQQRLPDDGGLGVSVEQDDGHGAERRPQRLGPWPSPLR